MYDRHDSALNFAEFNATCRAGNIGNMPGGFQHLQTLSAEQVTLETCREVCLPALRSTFSYCIFDNVFQYRLCFNLH